MAELSADVKCLLEQHPVFKVIDDGKKIQCSVTGHEMPCRADVIKQHLAGKKFQRKLKLHEFDYDQYKPHIVPSEKKWGKLRKQLFCKLTLHHINCDPHHVLRHVAGKRYKRAVARWEECQRTGQTFLPRGGSRNLAKGSGVEGEMEEDDDEEDSDSGPNSKGDKMAKGGLSEDGEGEEGWKELEAMVEGEEEKAEAEAERNSLADLGSAFSFGVAQSENVEEENAGPGKSASESGSEFEDNESIPEVKMTPTSKGQQKRKVTKNVQKSGIKKPKMIKQPGVKKCAKLKTQQESNKKKKVQNNKKPKTSL